MVDLAPQLIEGCDHAGVTMVVGGQVMTPAASGPVAIAVDKLQYEANQGPCLDALRRHAVFVTDDLATEDRWPEFSARAAAETGIHSMLSFRLFTDDDTLGSLNLYSAARAAFGSEATATGGVFAAHAALALASARSRERAERLAGDLAASERHARAMEHQAEAAVLLQHSMLSVLPTVEGLELAARYHPAVAVDKVGGDWYDAILPPPGGVALVIGDVAGHDMEAAVCMAQLRSMLRALAMDRVEPPSDILRRLDRITTQLGFVETVTCIYALLEPIEGSPPAPGRSAGWRMSFANAGHPPPLLIDGDGARYLDAAEHLILGLASDDHAARSNESALLAPGSTLLLYTDGLIERRDRSIDEGLAELAVHARRFVDQPLDRFCDDLVRELASHPPDDVCVLALRPG